MVDPTSTGESFWARVDHQTGTTVHVIDALGHASVHEHVNVHQCVWRMTATISFTDNLRHDSHSTQFFLNCILSWVKSDLSARMGETFTRLYIHSDNAAQHFKCRYDCWSYLHLKCWAVLSLTCVFVVRRCIGCLYCGGPPTMLTTG